MPPAAGFHSRLEPQQTSQLPVYLVVARSPALCSNKFKLIILDECDAMTRDAQAALRRGERGRLASWLAAAAGASDACNPPDRHAWLSASHPWSLHNGTTPHPLLFTLPLPCLPPSSSDGEVHAQRALLPHLQLRVQDHPRAAVALHALPLPAPARALCAGPPGAHLRAGEVREGRVGEGGAGRRGRELQMRGLHPWGSLQAASHKLWAGMLSPLCPPLATRLDCFAASR